MEGAVGGIPDASAGYAYGRAGAVRDDGLSSPMDQLPQELEDASDDVRIAMIGKKGYLSRQSMHVHIRHHYSQQPALFFQ